MTVKMVVTDIDGTFLSDQRDYEHERFNRQLAKMNALGIHFVVASGNQYDHLLDVFAAGNSHVSTFIAENGALIIDGGAIIVDQPIPDRIVKSLLTHISGTPLFQQISVHVSGRNGTYIQAEDPIIHSDTADYFLKNIRIVPDLVAVQDAVYKVNLDCPDQQTDEISASLKQMFNRQLHITQSGWGSIDIVPEGVDKGWAVRQLEKYWHIKPAEIVAFGDNFNDLEMLQHVQFGYVMKNARAAMQACGLPTTGKDNNHSGVLDVIDQIIDQELTSGSRL